MDHKVSKDMISSGMIPSGEKTQADLGRTQYGSAPSPSKLMDAYKSMYDKKEEVINEHHKKDADGNTIPHEDEELNEGAGLYANIHAKRKRGGKMRKKGDKGAPSSQDFANAARTAKEEVELDEFAVTGTLAALKGLGTMAAKLGVKAGAKLGGKAGANMMKSVARNPMKAVDNINRVGYAAQTVGNLMPKPGVPAVTKKQSQGGMVSADVDLFDIVKGQLLDEGYSEKEVNEIMVNLTEEQLEEFLKQLATRTAQYGANIGREGSATGFLNQRADKKKVLPVKDQPVKSATDVVKSVSTADKPKPTREKLNPEQKTIRKEITDKMKTQSQLFPIRRKKGQVEQENADLFDIVKGQLLDEGLSEEEIKDIMLTLTPDEILNEISVGKMANYISAADKDVQKTAASIRKDGSVMGDDPRVKRMSNRGKGMAMAGDKIARKMTPSLMSIPRPGLTKTEEYKNFDPKKPDPKQVAAQAQQEKNRQKFNDPMGVKNKNIGGQGLDPMDK